MPFTGSHPAAVLPFLRTGLPASALVIGSMTPDLPYFLPFGFPWPTHRPVSVVTVDLGLGLLLWAVWHALLAAPAVAASPAGLRARLAGRVQLGLGPRLRASALLLVPAALVVGAETHVLWDEFTHPGRFGGRHLSWLAGTWAGRPGTQWAQYVSGVAGITVLAVVVARWWVRTPPWPDVPPGVDRHVAVPAWGLVLVAGCLGASLGAFDGNSPRSAAFHAVTQGLGLAGAASMLLAAAWHLVPRPAGGRFR